MAVVKAAVISWIVPPTIVCAAFNAVDSDGGTPLIVSLILAPNESQSDLLTTVPSAVAKEWDKASFLDTGDVVLAASVAWKWEKCGFIEIEMYNE